MIKVIEDMPTTVKPKKQGPDRIHIKVISGSPVERFKEWRETNWSGSYSYHKLRNGREVYKVSFMLTKSFV